MTDAEAEALFSRISETLVSNRYAWVVEQVEAALRSERLQPVDLRRARRGQRDREEELLARSIAATTEDDASRSTARGGYVQTIPFTPQERLRHLVDAVEQVGVELPAMLDRTLQVLLVGPQMRGLEIVDEAGERAVFDVSRIGHHQDVIRRLKASLDDIRSDL